MLSSGRHTSRAGERCTRFIALHHPTLALLTMLVRFPHIFPANRLVLLFRLIFFAGSKALAEAKLIQPRPAPVIPTEWLTEEEVQPYLSSITRTINACICAAIKLSYGEDVKLCAQVIASLISLAYACRLMGVTGLHLSPLSSASRCPSATSSSNRRSTRPTRRRLRGGGTQEAE